MNRKSQTFVLEFLIKLIVAVILAVFIFALANRCIGNTSEAKKSFKEMVEKINSIKEGELLSMPLHMDKKTLIVFFNKDSNELKFKASFQGLFGIAPSPKIKQTMTDLNLNCNMGHGCICLYHELPEKIDGSRNKLEFTNNKICLRSTFDYFYEPGYRGDLIDPETSGFDTTNYAILGGTLIHRANAHKEPPTWNTRYGEYSWSYEKRTRTVYIENYRGVIIACEWQPCLTDENKKEMDDMINPITSN